MTVLAAHTWRNNAEMIADVARLGYLNGHVMDATYGETGGFWTIWRPDGLVAHDLKVDGVDFTALPELDATYHAVVFDPPYKLSGTPASAGFDTRYGVDQYVRWQDRMLLILRGVAECGRVVKPGGHLLVKCMDQVCSGQMRWQTDAVTRKAQESGFRKVDRFDLLGKFRPQPAGRSQVHARGRPSTLLVFRKESA